MFDGIDDLKDLMQRAEATPWGPTCSSLWAQAAALAEERGDLESAVTCYGELCAAYMMGGELTRVIAPFMWLDRMYKTRPELFSQEQINSLGWYYKYMTSALRNVPTISVPQCEAVLDEMRQYYLKLGDPMRAYHIRNYHYHYDLGDTAAAEESYRAWMSAENSDLSDCDRCDPGYEILYHSRRGEWDLAVAAGDRALSAEGEYCASQPEALLTELMEPWLRVGRDGEAWAAHVRAYRRYQQGAMYFEDLNPHLRYLGLSGRAGRPQRLERALTILIRHMPWWKQAETPRVLMDAAANAYVVLDSFPADEAERVLPVTLPGEELQWVDRPTLANPTIAEAKEWMRDLAFALASQFDARPGHPAPGIARMRVEASLHPEAVPALPDEGVMTDATGLGEFTPMSTFTTASVPLGERVAQVSTSSGTTCPEEGGVENSQGGASTEEEPPLVPLPLDGAWRSMSFAELIGACTSYGRHVPTIEFYRARELAWSDPSVYAEDNLPELTDAERETLRWVVTEAEAISSLNAEIPHEASETSDEAYRLLDQADKHLEEKRFMEAAQTADTAMRTPGVEPLGVRLYALGLLSISAVKAGYVLEAIDTLREAVNLAALLGLRVEQAMASMALTQTLTKARKYVEAAEVAQNALDIMEHYPQVYGPTVALNYHSAEAHSRLNHSAAAAEHHLASAVILRRAGESVESTIAAFEQAGEGFRDAHEYARAIEAHREAVALARSAFEDGKKQWLAAHAHEGSGEADATGEVKEDRDGAFAPHLHQLIRSLYQCSRAIVWQPGNVPEGDVAAMEALMEEMRTLVTTPAYEEFLPRDPAWREADWLSDMGQMMANAYRHTVAIDYFSAALSAFTACGDVENQALQHALIARVCLSYGDFTRAREELTEALSLVDAPQYAGSSARNLARQLMRELESAESDH